MVDVGKISGPAGPSEGAGKKNKSSADADKFHEAMKRRVQEVSQIDPDEKKKRKRGEEAEEEEEPLAEEPTPPSPVTPFSLQGEEKKPSLDAMQKQGPGISPVQSSKKTLTQSSSYQTSASDEMTDDSGLLEEGSFEKEAPQKPGSSIGQPSSPQTPQSGWTPEGQRAVEAGPPESQKSQKETVHHPSQKKKKQSPVGMGLSDLSPAKEVPQKPKVAGKKAEIPPSPTTPGYAAPSLEGAPSSKTEDTSAFFEQMGGKTLAQEQKKSLGPPSSKKIDEELGADSVVSPITPPAPPFETEKKESDEDKSLSIDATGQPLGGAESQAGVAQAAPETLPPYATLHPQIQELFDRMVGVMTVMNLSGMTETVITLNAPQFASSVFFGSQIIIQEFSTAPQAFNIQLNGTPQAVALFQGNADDLMAAFQAGNYNFRINRLETGHLAERPLFKRKEKAGGKDQDQTGGGPT